MAASEGRRLTVQAVIAHLDAPNEDRLPYLDRRNGELITLSRAEVTGFTIIDDYFDDEDEDDEPCEDPTAYLLLTQSAFKAGHLVPLPTRFDLDEHLILERFCAQFADEPSGAELLRASSAPDALVRFPLLAWQHGLVDAWEAYRERAIAEFATAWLDAHGIARD